MKTPDEIKKGLRCCFNEIGEAFVCGSCPYDNAGSSCGDVFGDALAYIQQLETKCHQLEQERDAAVEDLNMMAKCSTCKYYGTQCGYPPCTDCHPIEKQLYKWRGLED